MGRNWEEMEPTLGSFLRLKAEILWMEIMMFFMRIKRTVIKSALWLLRNGCM